MRLPPAPVAARKNPGEAVAGAAVPATAAKTSGDAGSIRVSTEKVDALINLVGELVITQSMLGRFADKYEPADLEALRRGLIQLTRNTRELQESVMQIRMLPIGFSFNRFPRLVHDLSRKLGKKVELKLSGENTELDKTVLEKIGDPLVHLVRNALDHGMELPAARLAAGKSETGTLELNAFHEGGSIIIEVKDDGAGLNKARILAKARERGLVQPDETLTDEQIYNLIFVAGFSTAEQVSDVSGRGVGMDVVRRNINDLGGHVQIFSKEGAGSTIRIRLPLTLAILEGQVLRVGKEIYVASLVSIIETVQPTREHLSSVAGRSELFRHRDSYLPIIRLHDLFDIEPDSRDIAKGLLVVVEADGRRASILVDELLAQQQVVIKSLETNFKQVPGLAGATIHGDGTVALILDVPGIDHEFPRAPVRTRRVGGLNGMETKMSTDSGATGATGAMGAMGCTGVECGFDEGAIPELHPGPGGVRRRHPKGAGDQGLGHGYASAVFAELRARRHQSARLDRAGDRLENPLRARARSPRRDHGHHRRARARRARRANRRHGRRRGFRRPRHRG